MKKLLTILFSFFLVLQIALFPSFHSGKVRAQDINQSLSSYYSKMKDGKLSSEEQKQLSKLVEDQKTQIEALNSITNRNIANQNSSGQLPVNIFYLKIIVFAVILSLILLWANLILLIIYFFKLLRN